jgi:thioredoxin-related protein
MKRTSLFIFIAVLFAHVVLAQSSDTSKPKQLYDPSDDAKEEIAKAVKEAEIEGKHVFLQIGGNWCGWCRLFDEKVRTNDTLRTVMEKNFVIYHVNYSQENKNEDVLASLGFPQRFGFPVFVILDSEGNRLHTQNSAYLEEGKGHSTVKILEFLKQWSPAAIDPGQYEHY